MGTRARSHRPSEHATASPMAAATDARACVCCAAALIHILRKRAASRCGAEQKAYADCVRGRVISVVRSLCPGGGSGRRRLLQLR